MLRPGSYGWLRPRADEEDLPSRLAVASLAHRIARRLDAALESDDERCEELLERAETWLR